MEARRTELSLFYEDVEVSTQIADYLIDFTYGDNAPGTTDDLQITIEDREQLWQGEWIPHQGDQIRAAIRVINWDGSGTSETLPCGTFDVDSIDFSGPPDTLSIKAVSVPIGSNIRREKRTKAWEKMTLKGIANEIAAKAKLSLLYEVGDNPKFERIDQTEQSDLAFLQEMVKKEGAAMKISGGKIVLFDEAKYEQQAPVLEIRRGDGKVLSFSFSWSANNAAYRACEFNYYDAEKKKAYKYTFVPPGAPEDGPVLKVNEQVKSQAEAMKLAKTRLREKNKEFGKGSFSLVGNVRIAAGITIIVRGWHDFDGKYIVVSAKHSIGSGGYRTDIEVRKVLGW
ncbi:late control protein [Brevibacillus sp. HB1.1]|uniref:phage late control D family protein n=1 Tax=Brevibacillus sp. HB1.1 TaxID=2738808 RepID=UPI0015773911|nr:contractile injection system protein, VgrG/Pvc8 family [Brevibacillus sp. HB1.1]NTU28846.1 late control protein [Brevibacillus sp. HB1.1]